MYPRRNRIMGYRDYLGPKKTSIWSDNNALLMLIILNVFAYIILRFILAVYGYSNLRSENFYLNIFEWFSMPARFSTFITRPWTLITSNFTQLDIWLLLSNMFWLWTYGFIFQDLTGNTRIIPLYLYGGIAGAVVYLIGYNVFPQMKALADNQLYFGATTSIIAIAMGATVFSPGYRLFPMIRGGIPLWVMTAAFGVIDVFYLFRKTRFLFPAPGFCAGRIFLCTGIKARGRLGRMDEQDLPVDHEPVQSQEEINPQEACKTGSIL